MEDNPYSAPQSKPRHPTQKESHYDGLWFSALVISSVLAVAPLFWMRYEHLLPEWLRPTEKHFSAAFITYLVIGVASLAIVAVLIIRRRKFNASRK